MKPTLTYLFSQFLLLLFAACSSNIETIPVSSSILSSNKTTSTNSLMGNVLVQDAGGTLNPIILSTGDTLQTGVPIPIKGTLIHPDNLAQPKVIKIESALPSFNAHSNVYAIPKNLKITPVNESSLSTIKLETISADDTAHFLVNDVNDTIRTGVAIPVIGKNVPALHSKPTVALLPRFKDASINNIQYLDVGQGLPSSDISAIQKDNRGNLWFGTNSSGLSQYDGKSFRHFTKKEGLSENNIYTILEDKAGNIWLGTQGGGVCKYDGKSFTHFTEKEGLANNYVYSIIEDKNGNFWFGTKKGLTKYDGKSFTHFTKKEGLAADKVRSILEDKNGHLWIGTLGGGVSRFDGESFTQFAVKDGLSNNVIYSIIEDKNGMIWLGTYGGVMCYDGISLTHFTKKEGLSSNKIRSIVEDKNGHLWFATHDAGVNRYDGHTFTQFTENEGLANNKARSIQMDNSGNLWFSTLGGGVNKYSEASFSHFTEKQGLSNKRVKSIVEDKNGYLWIGTNGGGINRYDGKTFTHFTVKEGFLINSIHAILEDKNSHLWIGTNGGVLKYDGASFTQFTEKEGLTSDYVYSIVEDKDGTIWWGTFGGVTRYDGKSFTHFTEKEGLSNNIVVTILEDKNGTIWFGSFGGGISRFDGDSLTHFTETEGLANNYVNSIVEDKDGKLWVGTKDGGLSRYDGESFTNFTETEGLCDNNIASIIQDNKGTLWVGTKNGLNQFVLKDGMHDTIQTNLYPNNGAFSIKQYATNDGLKSMDFFMNSVCLDSKNRMWWGNSIGLSMLDMTTLEPNNDSAVMYLTGVDIDGKYLDYRASKDHLNGDISYTDVPAFYNYPTHLELAHHKNHLTFHFVAIDWIAPHKVQYSYMMEGLNATWSKPSDDILADYRNIPYGQYTFKVSAINAQGQLSKTVDYPFTIHPPWWHSWWTRTGYVLLAIVLVLGLINWRTVNLRNRQKELQAEVNEATIDLNNKLKKIEAQKAERETLLKEVHHRVKNNLQVITGLLSLQSSNIKSSEIKDMFNQSQYRINSMGIIHEMLYKSENLSQIKFNTYLISLVNSLILSTKGNNNNISLNIDILDVALMINTAVPLGLIVNEILTNALSHGIKEDAAGEITIKLQKSGVNRYNLVIGDDGVGCPDNITFNNSPSLGLRLMKKLVRQLNGSIERTDTTKGCYYNIDFEEIN